MGTNEKKEKEAVKQTEDKQVKATAIKDEKKDNEKDQHEKSPCCGGCGG